MEQINTTTKFDHHNNPSNNKVIEDNGNEGKEYRYTNLKPKAKDLWVSNHGWTNSRFYKGKVSTNS